MKNKNSGFLISALAINTGLQLVNRFVVAIPDWLAIATMLLALALLFIYIVKNRF